MPHRSVDALEALHAARGGLKVDKHRWPVDPKRVRKLVTGGGDTEILPVDLTKVTITSGIQDKSFFT